MWTWKTWQGKRYLTCELLSQPHGFFTSAFYPISQHELVQALSNSAQAYRGKQVHGNTVLTPSQIQKAPQNEEGYAFTDGLMSDSSDQALFVLTADCTPALLEDQSTGKVAVVHAGWQGTALGIVKKAAQRMLDDGTQPGDLRIALGPAIAGEMYQVGEEVALEVAQSLYPMDNMPSTEEIFRQGLAGDNPYLLPDPKPGHYRLNTRRVSEIQLLQLGLQPDQIATAPHCTFQEPETFFSYRRTGEKKNQWSGIVSR
ncbi:MAG: peptidoglycan editing factor PgeF [Bacteroidota bacterium]